MLFFGGYSSILPYLLYLSVVWVCVLVGVRGNIWKIFKSADNSEHIIVSSNPGHTYEDVFILSAKAECLHNSEKDLHTNFTLPKKFSIQKNNQQIHWIVFALDWQHAHQISSRSLRGPPEFFV
jgi:hypothetical protein